MSSSDSSTNQKVKIGNDTISIRNIPKTVRYTVLGHNFMTTKWCFIDGKFFHTKIDLPQSDSRLKFDLGDKLEFEWDTILKLVDEKAISCKKKKSEDPKEGPTPKEN